MAMFIQHLYVIDNYSIKYCTTTPPTTHTHTHKRARTHTYTHTTTHRKAGYANGYAFTDLLISTSKCTSKTKIVLLIIFSCQGSNLERITLLFDKPSWFFTVLQ